MLLTTKKKTKYRRDTLLLRILPTLAVCLALMGLTLGLSQSSKQSLQQESQAAAGREGARIQAAIISRFRAYEEVLRGTTGLFNASQAVSADEWRTYISTFYLAERYPGIRSVGFAALIPAANLQNHIVAMRDSGYPNYTITPEGERTTYSSIIYYEPFNAAAIGYDMYADSIRREAMDLARDTNSPALSNRVFPSQPTADDPAIPRFFLYVPVYRKQAPAASIPERQAAVEGFTFAPFKADEFFKGVFGEETLTKSGFRVYAGSILQQNAFLYENELYKDLSARNDSTRRTVSFALYGQTWTIELYNPANDVPSALRSRPNVIIYSGIAFSILVSASVLFLLISRTRSLTRTKEMEVQSAKDELLSLAAHQLRTPATAVKQYIGMMIEGYAGKFSANQRILLDKAFVSNERQLKTVNEMLYVANADAGKLRLVKKELDLTAMIINTLDEQRGAFKQNKHSLNTSLGRRHIKFYGDELFLSMAFGNLLSNANKYTPRGGKISIKLDTSKKLIKISIKDNGVGIDKKQFNLLFKKFVRLDNGLTSQTIGSGLGLYLAKKLIELHDGYIDVSSKPRKGSEFTIVLPKGGGSAETL